MLLHLIGTEQLRSQRWLIKGVLSERAASAKAGPQLEQIPEHSRAARLQFSGPFLCSEISTNQIAARLSKVLALETRFLGGSMPAGPCLVEPNMRGWQDD